MIGKLIVIEGADGSGKKTQTELLRSRAQSEGFPVASLSFPQYGKKSAGLVEEYLSGAYGAASDVSPHASSLFYALDRYDASFAIRALLEQGTHVILDRYVDSNAGHQGGKIANEKEREHYLEWLYELEYTILKCPKPDLVIVLHLPAKESQRRIRDRAIQNNTEVLDIHEADIDHLSNAEKTYLWTALHNPSSHRLIECMEDNRGLTREEIHEKIWSISLPLLTGQSSS